MSLTRAVLLLLCVVVGSVGRSADPPRDTITVRVLHLNDTYEITPLNRGTVGGLSRVATIKKDLLKKKAGLEPDPLLTLHAGDFLSPSALGTARVDGKPLAGKQMVAVLKSVGIDYIIFGNHEFDLDKATFHERLEELRHLRDLPDTDSLEPKAAAEANDRRRALFATNVSLPDGSPFPGVPRSRIWEARTQAGEVLRVGLIGLTIKTKPKGEDYAAFTDPVAAAKAQLADWEKAGEKLDAVVALTHQSLDDDERLARAGLRIDLIVGGHEHENAIRRPVPAAAGRPLPPIFRADANARTVYLHHLVFDRKDRRLLRIESNLLPVTDSTPEDPVVTAVARQWVEQAYRAFRAQGLEPDEELTTLSAPLDGREVSVRNGSTALTELIGDAMLAPLADAPADARLAVYNSGAIRIDDQILPGPVTVYDVIRVLPFGGEVVAVPMPGEAVQRILDHKGDRPGTGGFLQARNATGTSPRWQIGGADLDPKKTYTVAINDFLLNGGEQGFEFLKDVPRDGARALGDWRKVVAAHLRGMKGGARHAASAGTTHELIVKVTGAKPPDGTGTCEQPGRVVVGGGEPIKVVVEGKGEKTDGGNDHCKWCFEPWQVLAAMAAIVLFLIPLLVYLRWWVLLGYKRIRAELGRAADQLWGRASELLAEAEALLTGYTPRDSGDWASITGRWMVGLDEVRRAWALLRAARPGRSPTVRPEDPRVSDADNRLTHAYALLNTSASPISENLARDFVRVASVLDSALGG